MKKGQLLPTGANSGRKMHATGPLVRRFLKINTNGGQSFTLHWFECFGWKESFRSFWSSRRSSAARISTPAPLMATNEFSYLDELHISAFVYKSLPWWKHFMTAFIWEPINRLSVNKSEWYNIVYTKIDKCWVFVVSHWLSPFKVMCISMYGCLVQHQSVLRSRLHD